jgi:hypothetical protein
MSDCNGLDGCECDSCCITPKSYTDKKVSNSHPSYKNLVFATAAAYPTIGESGDYFNDIKPIISDNPIENYTTQELDAVIDATNENIIPLFDVEPGSVTNASGSGSITTVSGSTASGSTASGSVIIGDNYPELFPNLNNKITTTRFTRYEVANFLDEFNLSPYTAIGISVANPKKMSSMWNSFLTASMAGLALCEFLKNPFGVLAILDDIRDRVLSAIDSFSGLINKLKDFVEKAKEFIDTIAETVKNKIENLTNKFNDVVMNTIGMKRGNAFQAMSQTFSDMSESIKSIFDESSKKSLKDRIESAIVGTLKGVAKITADVVDQILYVFCGITSGIEQMVNEKLASVKTFTDEFQNSFAQLQKVSGFNTKRAINFGRQVPTDESLGDACLAHARRVNGLSSPSIGATASRIYVPEYTSLPKPSEWSNLTFDSDVLLDKYATSSTRRTVYLDIPEKTGITPSPSWPWVTEPGSGRPIIYVGEGYEYPYSIYPYAGTNLKVLDVANQIARRMGKRFYINSGYRNDIYNFLIGGAKNSYHKSGYALDIGKGSMGDWQKARAEFRAHGFGGFGNYGSFCHFDMGPVREWSG